MELRAENVIFSKRRKDVKRIYLSSFKRSERMPFGMMMALSLLWNTQCLAFYDGDVLCGFVYCANIARTSFIMFFAVDESLRNKGYGSRILAKVQEMHPKNKIIVSIEPIDEAKEDNALRTRRKAFYMRNGYGETGYDMVLGTRQEVLIKNGVFKPWKFMLFFMLYSNLTIYPIIKAKK